LVWSAIFEWMKIRKENLSLEEAETFSNKSRIDSQIFCWESSFELQIQGSLSKKHFHNEGLNHPLKLSFEESLSLFSWLYLIFGGQNDLLSKSLGTIYIQDLNTGFSKFICRIFIQDPEFSAGFSSIFQIYPVYQ